MPLTALLRGLAGLFAALAATLILLLCLAETRVRFGVPTWGVAWMTLKGRTALFDPIWHPLLFYGSLNGAFGFVMALRLTTLRTLYFVLTGALLFFILGRWIDDGTLSQRYGQAGVNCSRLLLLFFVILGATAGAYASERGGWLMPKKRPKASKHDSDLPLCRQTPVPPEQTSAGKSDNFI